MTVALVLAGQADAGLCDQLAALGVRRVDAAERTRPGLLTVAAAARAAGEGVLLCVGAETVCEQALARLLGAGGTAAFTGMNGPAPAGPDTGPGALMVDARDLDALARAAEFLAATHAGPPAVGTLIGELTRRGVTVRILDAGPDGEGAVARLLADPAARDVARWAAGRRLTPGALYGISLGLGLLAAVWFSELAVLAKLLAAAALAVAFLTTRAGSLLVAASPEGRVRPAVSWLGAACGLLTELGIYAALAVSSWTAGPPQPGAATGLDGIFGGALQHTFAASWAGAGQAGVWQLAIAASLVLGLRRVAELGYEQTARVPGSLFSFRPGIWLSPAGERYAVIVVTAVFFGPRLTFLVLLGWGVVAAGCVLAGQMARSAVPAAADGEDARPGGALAAYRGDGILARWVGSLVQGRLPPLPPALVGLFVTCVLASLGLANLPGILVLTPFEAMMLAALGAWHPHDGRLDWLVPALLAAGECVFLAALGLSRHVAGWLVFALLASVVMRYADLAYRARAGRGLAGDVAGLGWDGRMLVAGVSAVAGFVPVAYAMVSGYLWVLFCWDFLSGWLPATEGDDG